MAPETDPEKHPATASPDVARPSEDTIPKYAARPECFRSTIHEILFVLTATMAVAMSSFLAGTMTVILTSVGRDLNMTQSEITWINASSSLTSGSFLFFFGRLADLFGRKTLFAGSLFVFAILSIGAGFSQNAITMDVMNALMGLASAACVPPAQGILGVIYEKPSKRKNKAFACFSAGNPLGFVFGTIFSGVAAQIFNWRASLWLLAIIYAVFGVIAIFMVPNDHEEKEKFDLMALKKFDLVGTALTVGGIGMFSASLSLGADAPQGWKTPYVLVVLILGVLLLVAFVLWENWYEYPLIPMGIWKDRNFSLVISILVLGFLGFSAQTLWIALYLQDVSGFGPLMVAVHMLPMAIVGILVNVFAGFTLHKMSNKQMMYIGATAYIISFVLTGVNLSHDSYWAFFFPALCLVVVGADLEFNVSNMYVLSSMAPHQQSIAGSIIQTANKLCVAVAYGISTAIFNSVSESPPKTGYYGNDPAAPYAGAFWMGTGFAVFGLLLCPLLTISTQGHDQSMEKGLHGDEVVGVESVAAPTDKQEKNTTSG